MLKTLWLNNQITNAKPRVTPTENNCQNHLANRAPARMAKPTRIGAKNAASPIRGFGNPRILACSVSITDLQEINGLTSQLSTASGFEATLIRSSVSTNAAAQPTVPLIISSKARDLGAPIRGLLVANSILTV